MLLIIDVKSAFFDFRVREDGLMGSLRLMLRGFEGGKKYSKKVVEFVVQLRMASSRSNWDSLCTVGIGLWGIYWCTSVLLSRYYSSKGIEGDTTWGRLFPISKWSASPFYFSSNSAYLLLGTGPRLFSFFDRICWTGLGWIFYLVCC